MCPEQDSQRHSRAIQVELITDPSERARQEARNGLRQFDQVIEAIEYWLQPDRKPFRLRPSTILTLNRIALEGINSLAGVLRPSPVEIVGSKHSPPPPHLVPELVENMCDYINDQFEKKSPIHLSAYAMWRMNWIHPFNDGNGRTARAVSYLVLCVRLGTRLPGTSTIPEQIAENRDPYYEALEAADSNATDSTVDLSKMEALLESLLAKQLVSVLRAAKADSTSEASAQTL
jgi:Fic family protein